LKTQVIDFSINFSLGIIFAYTELTKGLLAMISKKIALFAIGSMFAAGATLASNVTFGERAARWVSENFDFVGPLGSAISSVVRPADYNRKAPVMGFQVGAAANNALVINAGQPLEIAAYDPKYGLSRQSMSVRALGDKGQVGGAEGFAGSSDANSARAAGKIQFSGLVGNSASSINDLAKNFLRSGSLLDQKDVDGLLNSRSGLKGGFNTSASASDSVGASDIALILSAATNGNPLVATSVTGTTNGPSLSVATAVPTPNKPATTTPSTGTPLATNDPAAVPAPGVLGLLAIGLAAVASTSRSTSRKK
jgi:hypothetical protein